MKEYALTSADIAAYAGYLHSEERAAATVDKYLRDIRTFAVWLNGRPVTKETAAEWKSFLTEHGCAASTVNTKLSAINGLFRFLNWDGCRVKFLSVQRRIFRETSRELTQGEYIHLVETARRLGPEWLPLVMETLCGLGLRVSEIQYITVEAAQIGQVDVVLKGKIRTIILPGKLARKLLKYARKQKIVSGAIFRTGDGTPLSRFKIWRAMKALCAKAGVEPTKVFPHNLRHLFAVAFYRATRDIVKLADILGHSSVNTTRIYLLTSGAEHAQQMEKLGLVT